MEPINDDFRIEILSRTREVFEALFSLEKIKAISRPQVGRFVLWEMVGDQPGLYVKTLSAVFGQLANFISGGGDVEFLRTLAKRNGWILAYHRNLVSSWQKRKYVVWAGGAVKLRKGLIFSFKSSIFLEDSTQGELVDEAVVLCAARGLALAEKEEMESIARISQNSILDELWSAFWH